jgi:hypothetical protein
MFWKFSMFYWAFLLLGFYPVLFFLYRKRQRSGAVDNIIEYDGDIIVRKSVSMDEFREVLQEDIAAGEKGSIGEEKVDESDKRDSMSVVSAVDRVKNIINSIPAEAVKEITKAEEENNQSIEIEDVMHEEGENMEGDNWNPENWEPELIDELMEKSDSMDIISAGETIETEYIDKINISDDEYNDRLKRFLVDKEDEMTMI